MLPRAQAEEVRKLAARTDAFLEQHFCLDRGWLAWAAQLLHDCAAVTDADSGAGLQVQLVFTYVGYRASAASLIQH